MITNAKAARQAIQEILHVNEDGEIGPETMKALNFLCALPDGAQFPLPPNSESVSGDHRVLASDFADPSDLRGFNSCKAEGKTDGECFRVGDNCIGKWGKSTAEGTGPCFALPPEEWAHLGDAANGAVLVVTNPANGKTVEGDLRDTMPHIALIENGCRIDCNPDAIAALGLVHPVTAPVVWRWK